MGSTPSLASVGEAVHALVPVPTLAGARLHTRLREGHPCTAGTQLFEKVTGRSVASAGKTVAGSRFSSRCSRAALAS